MQAHVGRARCPDGHRRLRKLRIVEGSSANEYQVRSGLRFAKQWRATARAEAAEHPVSAVRHARIVARRACNLEGRRVEARSDRGRCPRPSTGNPCTSTPERQIGGSKLSQRTSLQRQRPVKVMSLSKVEGVPLRETYSRVSFERCRLTPPSSGRPKGRFAPFAPPLMSNVRSQWRPIPWCKQCGRQCR